MSENEQIQEQAQVTAPAELDETDLESVSGGTGFLAMPAIIVAIPVPTTANE